MSIRNGAATGKRARRKVHTTRRTRRRLRPIDEITTFLQLIGDGGVIETRLLKCRRNFGGRPFVVAGYWSDYAAAAHEVRNAGDRYQPDGMYVTLNQIDPALLSRAMNQLKEYPEATTTDTNVVRRTHLLIDVDPLRVSGVSATENELRAAARLASRVKSWLCNRYAWPAARIELTSGNGYHLIYAIDLPNDDGVTKLVRDVLTRISEAHSTDVVAIDASTHSAGQLTKIAGTWARKGDNTEERPHRRARLLGFSSKRNIVSREMLESVVGHPSESTRTSLSAIDRTVNAADSPVRLRVEAYLDHYHVGYRRIPGTDDQDRTRWALDQCPFHGDHGGRDTAILQSRDGQLGFHCFHDRCKNHDWQSLRAKIGRPLPEHYDPPVDTRELRNFRLLGQDSKSTSVGRSITEITESLYELTDGWPRRVGRDLFVPGADHRPIWFSSPSATTDLFAWVQHQAKTNWQTGPDKITQAQLCAHLQMTAQQYAAVETVPHWPEMPDVYYMHPALPETDGSHLEHVVSRFRPLTPVDRELIRALILTLVWGGPPGARPMFVILGPEEDGQRSGRGVGKTKLAQMAGELVGGYMSFSARDDIAAIKKRLLSPAAQHLRIALLDNVKAHRLSWAELEDLVTASVISGHRMYQGEGRRANTLVWAITINGGKLSKDLAQRSVIIRLARPTYTPSWEEETRRYVQEYRWQIIADCIRCLSGENR